MGKPFDDSRRIAITGGSGFIGTNLVAVLSLDPNTEVVNLDATPPRNEGHTRFWRQVDVRDRETLTRELADFAPHYLIHLGARTDLHGLKIEDYDVNTSGVKHVVEVANQIDSIRRVIFASSRLVCEIGYQPSSDTDYCPPNLYGQSKVEGERIVRAHCRKPWVILRPTSIWGPWFGVPYRDFFDNVLRGTYVHISKKPVEKSFGYVGNAVHQIIALLTAPLSQVEGRTFYLSDYEPIEVRAFAEMIRQKAGLAPLRAVPYPLMRAVAGAGDIAARCGVKHVPLTSFRLANLLTPMIHDSSELSEIAGDLPYSSDEGIEATLAWLRTQ
ncbi:NAD-dependent epimerase/dehydratase family protein [Microbacterium sp. HA-8]|uniref:NAD-dependent epimerase/dehydratase family protein n=1 Tax=Microbacterium sp. HA-8 TaxID=3234200 RepID=UPI0038F624D8